MNDPKSTNSQKPISSEEIRQNFRHEKKERYLGIKLLVGFGFFAIMFFIYHFVEKTPEPVKSAKATSFGKEYDTISKIREINSVTGDTSTKLIDNNSKQSSLLQTAPVNDPIKAAISSAEKQLIRN